MTVSIIIPRGSGKSTITKLHPNLFLDIDKFIWDPKNEEHHAELYRAINNLYYEDIDNIYKKILTNKENKKFLQQQDKILLLNHPTHAEWIGIKAISILKPTFELLIYNIRNRNRQNKRIAIKSWYKLDLYNNEAEIFNTRQQLEDKILDIQKKYLVSSKSDDSEKEIETPKSRFKCLIL